MKSIYDIKKISSMLLLVVVFVLGSACTKDTADTNRESTTSEASDSRTAPSEFDTAYKAADALRLQAAELEYEWRDTEKFLLEAKNAYANGNKELALQLVNKAHQQAELAITQAQAEKTAWTSRVPN